MAFLILTDKRLHVSYVLIAVYVSISLLPSLSSGYYSDDLITSTVKGQLELRGISFVQYFIDLNRHWLIGNGRFFPVAMLTTLVISYNSYHLQLYKLFILSLIVVNVLLFGYLLHVITRNRYASYLGMLLTPILFQFRLYHDPILSFCGNIQLFLSLILCALIFLCRYLEHNNTRDLIGSLVSYNLALYSYEVGILLSPLFLIILANQHQARSKRAIKIMVPYAISVAIALMVMLVARQLKDPASPGYPGITFNMEPARVFKTFLVQAYASLPLSYYASNPSHLFHHAFSSFVSNIEWHDIFVVAIFIAFYIVLVGKLFGTQRVSILFYLGSALMFCPAIAISMSLKYQEQLRYFGRGMGHVPVYIQYYGTALLMTGAIVLALQKLYIRNMRILVHIGVIAVISTTWLVNMQSNRLVIEKANIDLHYRRAALTRALGENILQNIPEHAKLYILDEYTFDPYPSVKSPLKDWGATGYQWKNEAFVYLYAKKRVQIIKDVNGLLDSVQSNNATDGSVNDMYLLNIKSYPDNLGVKEGYVVLSRIHNIQIDEAGKIQFQSTPLRSSFPPQT